LVLIWDYAERIIAWDLSNRTESGISQKALLAGMIENTRETEIGSNNPETQFARPLSHKLSGFDRQPC